MQKYTILATATFNAGILGLDLAQAAARRHALKPLGKGLYQIEGPVQFKAGEKIEYDGEVPKAMAELLDPPPAPVKAAAKPRFGKFGPVDSASDKGGDQ